MIHERNPYIDILRGLTLLSMIAYHTMWDLVFLFSWDAPRSWYTGTPGFLWQQSICWTFILLSGYCTNLSSHSGHAPCHSAHTPCHSERSEESSLRRLLTNSTLRRGIIVFACGLLIMAVTAAVMPESRVVFGVLTLIGSGMILVAVLPFPFAGSVSPIPLASPSGAHDVRGCTTSGGRRFATTETECRPSALRGPEWNGDGVGAADGEGLPASATRRYTWRTVLLFLLFLVTYRVGRGYLLLPGMHVALPKALYANTFTAFLGFPPEGFFSTDYFSLLPWLFLFFTGRSLYSLLPVSGPGSATTSTGSAVVPPVEAPASTTVTSTSSVTTTPLLLPLSLIGRHSLPIYMVHQPVIYGILLMISSWHASP